MQRSWTKIKKRNFRVEIEAKGYSSHFKTEEQRCDSIVDDLNDLFEAHKKCPYEAITNYDEYDACKFCGEEYEEVLDESSGPCCAHCGRGEKEFMVEKLS